MLKDEHIQKTNKRRAHSETTSTFGNQEKNPKRKRRIDEHIRKSVEKPAKGLDRRTQYDIYVTVIFWSYRKLEDKVSLKIRPVNKWNKFTAIKIQVCNNFLLVSFFSFILKFNKLLMFFYITFSFYHFAHTLPKIRFDGYFSF